MVQNSLQLSSRREHQRASKTHPENQNRTVQLPRALSLSISGHAAGGDQRGESVWVCVCVSVSCLTAHLSCGLGLDRPGSPRAARTRARAGLASRCASGNTGSTGPARLSSSASVATACSFDLRTHRPERRQCDQTEIYTHYDTGWWWWWWDIGWWGWGRRREHAARPLGLCFFSNTRCARDCCILFRTIQKAVGESGGWGRVARLACGVRNFCRCFSRCFFLWFGFWAEWELGVRLDKQKVSQFF